MNRNKFKNEARLLTQEKVRTQLRTRGLSQDLSSDKSYSQASTSFLDKTMDQIQEEMQASVMLKTKLAVLKASAPLTPDVDVAHAPNILYVSSCHFPIFSHKYFFHMCVYTSA